MFACPTFTFYENSLFTIPKKCRLTFWKGNSIKCLYSTQLDMNLFSLSRKCINIHILLSTYIPTHRDCWPCRGASRCRPPPPCRRGARSWSSMPPPPRLTPGGHCHLGKCTYKDIHNHDEKVVFNKGDPRVPWMQWIPGNCKHLLCIDMLILYWLLAWNALLSFISWRKIL